MTSATSNVFSSARTSALLASHDDRLVDTVLRLAAAAGVEIERASDPGAAVARWSASGSVIVGADSLPQVARLGPHRREGVIVVVAGLGDESVLRQALAIGADHVAELPQAEPWLLDRLTELADAGAGVGQLWGFVGTSGGAGASTLAAAAAIMSARALPTALVDLDPFGAGVERVLGVELEDGIRWADLHAAPGRLTSRSLREALPRRSGPAVLGFGSDPRPVDPVIAREVLTAARRGHGVVVADLPRWDDDAATSVLPSCDRLVVICPASVRGVAGARRLLGRLPVTDPVELVVRASSRSVDAEDVAGALGFVDAVVLREDRRLEESLDLGLGPCHRRRSPVTRAAELLVRRLGGDR